METCTVVIHVAGELRPSYIIRPRALRVAFETLVGYCCVAREYNKQYNPSECPINISFAQDSQCLNGSPQLHGVIGVDSLLVPGLQTEGQLPW